MRPNYSIVMTVMLVLASVSDAQEDIPLATPIDSSVLTDTDTEPAPKAAEAKPSQSAGPSARPLSATITLLNQSVIRGTLTDTTEITMKSVVGEISVPLSEVAGIRFATQEETTTTIVMLNGDSFTGATNVQLLNVETEWGAARINGSGIAGVMLVPNLQWSSIDGLNGKRWYLTESIPPRPPSNASGVGSAPVIRPSSPQYSPYRTR